MQFIFGLIIGAALVFGWSYTQCIPKSELAEQQTANKAALDYLRATDAAALETAKSKIKGDYEAALRAAESRETGANNDLAAARSEMLATKVEMARLAEETKELKAALEKARAMPAPMVQAPVVQAPAVDQKTNPAPVAKQSTSEAVYVKPVQKVSTFGAARPTSIKAGGTTTGRYRLQRKMDGSVVTNYY